LVNILRQKSRDTMAKILTTPLLWRGPSRIRQRQTRSLRSQDKLDWHRTQIRAQHRHTMRNGAPEDSDSAHSFYQLSVHKALTRTAFDPSLFGKKKFAP